MKEGSDAALAVAVPWPRFQEGVGAARLFSTEDDVVHGGGRVDDANARCGAERVDRHAKDFLQKTHQIRRCFLAARASSKP